MQKILIDLSTIWKNPNYVPAGCRNYTVGSIRITFTCNGTLPESFVEDKNIIITSFDADSITGHRYEGIIIGEIDIPALEKEKRDVVIKWKRESYDMTTLFEDSLYLFDYMPAMVKCTECGAEFDHKELESDSTEDDDYYVTSEAVCPMCGKWDCCEIKYEDIEEALKRKAIADAPTSAEFEQQVKDLQEFEEDIITKITGVPKIVVDDKTGNGGC